MNRRCVFACRRGVILSGYEWAVGSGGRRRRSRNAAVSHSSGREPRDRESTRFSAQPPRATSLGAWPRAMWPWEVVNSGALSPYLSGLTPRAIRYRPDPGLGRIPDGLRRERKTIRTGRGGEERGERGREGGAFLVGGGGVCATIHRDSRRVPGDCSEKDSGPARGSTGKPTITGATAPDDAMLQPYLRISAAPAARSKTAATRRYRIARGVSPCRYHHL